MPYVTPPARADGDVIDAGDWNQDLRTNMQNMAPDVFTTKGDLFVATAADIGARLGVGTNGKVLRADSTQSTGLGWGDAGSAVQNISISSVGPHSLGPYLSSGLGGAIAALTWTANIGVFLPFQVAEECTITYGWTTNSATVNGNWDIGIYDNSFNRLASTGAFAMSGANVLQTQALSYTLSVGTRYFMALSSSSSTAQIAAISLGAAYARSMGCYQNSSAHVLPSTITPATWAVATGIPVFGLATRQLL